MDARAQFCARTEGDRKFHDDYDGMNDMSDVDIGITENGQVAFEHSDDDDDDSLDGLNFSVPANDRTLGSTEQSIATTDTIDTSYTDGAMVSVGSDSHSVNKASKDRSSSMDSKSSNRTTQSPDRKQQSFQSLLPMPEHPTRQRSAPRAIPKPPQSQNQPFMSAHPASQPSSAGSTASTFLNNLLDPAASTFNNSFMSHTPPTHIATSYEASHFGKRARSGVSPCVII